MMANVSLGDALKTRSIEAIEKAAKEHDAESLYLIAMAKEYGIGQGMVIDRETGIQYLKEASDLKFPRAMYAYANLLAIKDADNLHEAENQQKAFELWNECHRMNFAPCTAQLGYYYAYSAPKDKIDVVKAYQYAEEANKKGDMHGKVLMGSFFWYGTYVAKNKATALKIFEEVTKGCNANDLKTCSSYALSYIAYAYRYGVENYPNDPAKGLALYLQAADLGNLEANYTAALMLMDGDKVPKDVDKGAKYLVRAMDRQVWQAMSEYVKRVLNKEIQQKSSYDIEKLALLADQHGYPEGLTNLVYALTKGTNGKEKNIRKAAELANYALANFNRRAIDEEGAYPGYAEGFVNTIRQARAENITLSNPAISDSTIQRLYGNALNNAKRFTIPIDCGIPEKTPFYIYIWDAEESIIPLRNQFEWIEKARNCNVPEDVKSSFEKLFKIAKDNHVSFVDLSVYALGNAQEEKKLPLETSSAGSSQTTQPVSQIPANSNPTPVSHPATETFPAQLSEIIVAQDWYYVKAAIGSANAHKNVNRQVKWANTNTQHSGYVKLTDPHPDEFGCYQFRVASWIDGVDQRSFVDRCPNGTIK